MSDPYAITSEDQLQAIIGEPLDFVLQKVVGALDDSMIEFVRRSPLLFLSTLDENLQADVSPKGDTAGFVQVDEQGRLLVPDRKGNKLVFGFKNILRNPNVGLIFVVPGMRETLRVKGRAILSNDPQVLQQLEAQGKPALLCTRVEVDECFFHCGKAMIRSKLWQPDAWAEYEDSLIIRQIATKMGADEAVTKIIEDELEKDYREQLY